MTAFLCYALSAVLKKLSLIRRCAGKNTADLGHHSAVKLNIINSSVADTTDLCSWETVLGLVCLAVALKRRFAHG